MYVRISRARCDPSQCDAVVAVAEQTNPALRRLPGFQSSYWGVDRANGELVAVSTWDTRDHAGFSREALIAAAESADAGPAAERRIEQAGFQMDPPQIFEMAARVP
jgi:heme-degrading monooxygenase HmoA